MTGISEILLLIFLITALLILPRLFKAPPSEKPAGKTVRKIGRKMRAAIAASAIYPLVTAVMIRPWQSDLLLFIGAGIFPVFLSWVLFWIFSAPKK